MTTESATEFEAELLDELPLWSAPFGLALLDRVRLRPGLRVLDVGCGSGFPLLELAQRLGPTGAAFGIDPWAAALDRLTEKLRRLGLVRAAAVRGDAGVLPFRDASLDLIVSNNGLNNVRDPEIVLAECRRTARPAAQLVATMNLPGTMAEFYDVFASTLGDMNRADEIETVEAHRFEKRRPAAWWVDRLGQAGFRVETVEEDSFVMRYLDGTSLFRHYVIRHAFLPAWRECVAPEARPDVFAELERNLNARAKGRGGLTLTVPFACYDARRI